MSSLKLFPFMSMGEITEGSDLNDITTSGMYVPQDLPIANYPPEESNRFMCIIVFSTTGGSGGNPIIQLAFRVNFTTPYFYIRGKWGGGWSNWSKIAPIS